MPDKEKDEKVSLPFFGIPRILPYVKSYRPEILIMVGTGLVASIIDVLIPLYQRYALNHFVGEGTLDTLPWFILIFLLSVLVTGVCNYVNGYLAQKLESSINRDLRALAFRHLQTLSFSYYNQNSVGYIHSRVMSDTSRIGILFSWSLVEGSWQMAYLIGAIAVMLAINARLALLILLVLPLIAVFFSIFQSKLIAANREVREINSRITGNFNEGITGARTIKTLAVEKRIGKDFTDETAKMRRTTVRAARYRGLFASTISLASSLALYSPSH